MGGALSLHMEQQKEIFFLKLKLPVCSSLFFLSFKKLQFPLSVIGAAIGEWIGAQAGLGYFQ